MGLTTIGSIRPFPDVRMSVRDSWPYRTGASEDTMCPESVSHSMGHLLLPTPRQEEMAPLVVLWTSPKVPA